jgi:1,4-alpha-glucan branching enzyme
MAFDPGGELTGWDLTGFHEGHDTEAWRRLGAHEITVTDSERGQVAGTRFAVWAPNAQAVRLVGDFNYWNGDSSPMHLVPGSGVWSLFVEGVGTGTLYKFEVLGADGVWRLKADPFAQFCEAPPHNASIVYESQYAWGDDEWLWYRGQKKQYQEPVSAYEVHLGSWRKGLTYVELARQLVEYVTWQGFTHVEFMPVAEHPYDGSWGYHVTGYFAPISRFGSPDEFRYLVDELHKAGVGVIVDWVPGHFATDPWALQRFDGTALFEHEDPRLGWHPDWGSYIFNFGRNEVKAFLISNAFYWLEEFHIDGLRIDAVASMLYLDYSREAGQWVPNIHGGNENLEAVELLQRVNEHNYRRKPGIMMIAEESTSWPGVTRSIDHGGLGFGFKWNMGWMNDSLRYLGREPVYRQYHHHEMTFAMAYAYSENFVLPISHDEVVHGKGSMFERMPQDEWRKFGTLRAFYAFMWAHPGKKLLFMGTEFGQRREFSESRSIDWDQSAHWGHRGVQRLVKDLNGIYTSHPALFKLDSDPAGFRWINADDGGGNVFSWVRYDGDGQMIACITNFSSEPRPDYRVGLPAEGAWQEILNTDSDVYDGTGGIGNLGQVMSHPVPSNGFPASASVTIPPLGAVWLLHQAAPTEESEEPEKVTAGTREVAKQASPRPTRRVAQVVGVSEGESSVSAPATTPAKKAPAKKAPAKKATTEKAPAKKATTEKAPAEKTPAKKTATKKAATTKAAAEKALGGTPAEPPAEKAASKAAAVKETVEKAAAAVKKAVAGDETEVPAPAAKKAPAKKAATKKTAAKKTATKKATPPPES